MSTSERNEDQSASSHFEVRGLVSIAEMRETEDIQREVWGLDDIDIVPAAQLKAAVHAGGQVAGAFDGEEMVGFAYGLVATPHGRGSEGLGLHSHMVAVRERGRLRGVGRALKWFQRQWCLDRGMAWITWTFDPLQARNANLNFAHLGVVSHEYLVDFYGVMAGSLGSTASDRLVALWLLDSEPVKRRAAEWVYVARTDAHESKPRPGSTRTRPPQGDSGDKRDVWVLREEDVAGSASEQRGGAGGPDAPGGRHPAGGRHPVGAKQPVSGRHSTHVVESNEAFRVALADTSGSARLLVAAPHDVGALMRSQPEAVERWRSGLRAAIIPALEAGYSVVGFADGVYRLERT